MPPTSNRLALLEVLTGEDVLAGGELGGCGQQRVELRQHTAGPLAGQEVLVVLEVCLQPGEAEVR